MQGATAAAFPFGSMQLLVPVLGDTVQSATHAEGWDGGRCVRRAEKRSGFPSLCISVPPPVALAAAALKEWLCAFSKPINPRDQSRGIQSSP